MGPTNRGLLAGCASVALAGVIAVAGATWAEAQVAQNIGYGAKTWDGSPGIPIHPDQSVELAMKIKQPFTVVGVGDLLQFQPFANSNDPDVQYLLDILRKADVTVGDFENEIMDFDNFGHYGGNLATKEVADDWAKMGIDMVSRANNKVQRAPGVWEDFHQVERVGIIHVGAAHTLPEARMARYYGSTKGLVGFAGLYSEGGTDACCAGGTTVAVTPAQLEGVRAIKASILARRNEVETPVDMPPADPEGRVSVFGVTFTVPDAPALAARQRAERVERPLRPEDGVMNTIHLTLYHGVTADQMALLRAIAGDKGTGPDLAAWGTHFRVMDRPGEHSFEMDPKDVREALTQIRTGKQASDVMVSNFHWHQNRYDFQHYSYDHFPADFEMKFAHMAIDEGDDVFIAQGVHTIKGIEIYKGKPIFYGTSNFIFQSAIMPRGVGREPGATGPDEFAGAGGPFGGALRAAAQSNDIVGEHEVQGFWQLKPNLESFIAYSHFENGKLAEVRIYPVDLGQTPRPGSQLGIPRRPSPAVAQKILEEVIEYSKPFGTKIEVENGVGVIRIANGGQISRKAPAGGAKKAK